MTHRVGGGGTGVVYRATDTLLGRTVAVKALDITLDPEIARREARALARLDHPHIVALHDLLEDNGRIYLVMEFVEGVTLEERLEERGALDLEPALRLIRQVGGAVARAHAAGILHCDIKPANVLIAESGMAKLADFTLARHLQGAPAGATAGATAGFAAPEQWHGGPIDGRTDVYALGRLLAVTLGGPNPRSSRDRAARAVIARATADDPAQRFAGVGEMLTALPAPREDATQVAGHVPPGGPTRIAPILCPVPISSMAPRTRGRRRLLSLPTVAGAVLAGVGLVTYLSAAASPDRVTLPNFTRVQGIAAERVSGSLRLRVVEVRRYSATVPAGAVIAQRPAAGVRLSRDAVVTLVVSRGPRPVAVPDLLGATQPEAVSALRDLGLRVRVTSRTAIFERSGRVLGETPGPGVSRVPGSTVTLTVSRAPCWGGIIAC